MTLIIRIISVVMTILLLSGCSTRGQSLLLYRMPYANGTQVSISQDHLTHAPPNRVDINGVDSNKPYRVVAAQSGVVKFIVDDNTDNCCKGSCGNNYVWIEHIGGEWTKYSHLATGSVTRDAGLSVGDVVVAGTFLGYESDVGRACGEHLHFEVAVPDDPNNPLKPGNGGFIDGVNRIPRICGVPGQILWQGSRHKSSRCDLLVDCIQSVESPSTEGNCEPGIGGDVCVQEITNVSETSTYKRGEDFSSSSVKIDLDWCPNADCDLTDKTGRAIQAVFLLDEPNAEPIDFVANCKNNKIVETVHNVKEIIIKETPNLSEENVACKGNETPDAFAKWEICEVSPFFSR